MDKKWLTGIILFGLSVYLFNSFLKSVMDRSERTQFIAENRFENLIKGPSGKVQFKDAKAHYEKPHLPETPKFGFLKQENKPLNPTIAQTQPKAVAGAEAKKPDPKKDDKKKKKKKKNPPKAMIIQRKPYQPRQDMARAESAEETPMTNYYSKPLAKENEKADPNSPAAISDWERKLLNPPSYQETTALINAYQSGQMTDENFYNLVDKMLSSDSEEARIYAIMALQGTPSVPSFERLAKLLASENNQVLVVRIQESLKTYHASQHLHVLTLSLQSDEVHARTQAAVLIQESAKINLKPEQVANSGESPRLIRGAATNVQNVGGNNPPTAFRQAQRALQSALAIEPDANTKNLIKNSLDYLNQMMGPLSQIAATPTT